MKVICIDGVKKGCIERMGKVAPAEAEVFEGETYTVVGEEQHSGNIYYELSERDAKYLYHKDRFAPLSSIDETEMQRDYSTIKTLTP